MGILFKCLDKNQCSYYCDLLKGIKCKYSSLRTMLKCDLRIRWYIYNFHHSTLYWSTVLTHLPLKEKKTPKSFNPYYDYKRMTARRGYFWLEKLEALRLLLGTFLMEILLPYTHIEYLQEFHTMQ